MADKELRRMSRAELIEIIYALQQNEKAIRSQNDELTRQLEDKILRIENAGSIAEAALSLNRVFEDAQKAADQYLDSVRMIGRGAEAETLASYSDGVLLDIEEKSRVSEAEMTETEEKLHASEAEMTETEEKLRASEARMSETEEKLRASEAALQETEERLRKAREQYERIEAESEMLREQARQQAEAVLRKAEEDGSRIREQAQWKTAAGVQRFWKDVEMVLRKHPELAAGLYEERPGQKELFQRAEAN
ncbi:MAG: hypothetical protein LUF30_07270 [Lachnospiraceae bacterium]|nr:hypothetical protein [Lachnospiraceae bacterium]